MEKARLIETLEAMRNKADEKRIKAKQSGLENIACGNSFEAGAINVIIGMLESDEYAEMIRAAYIKEGE